MKVNQEVLEELKVFPENTPIFMLNYLNYKEIVEETGKTGKQTYADYMQAALPFFEHIDANIIFKGTPVGIILGPLEEAIWDEVLVVKYASKNDFFKLMMMKDYPRELRASALTDSRLIFCK